MEQKHDGRTEREIRKDEKTAEYERRRVENQERLAQEIEAAGPPPLLPATSIEEMKEDKELSALLSGLKELVEPELKMGEERGDEVLVKALRAGFGDPVYGIWGILARTRSVTPARFSKWSAEYHDWLLRQTVGAKKRVAVACLKEVRTDTTGDEMHVGNGFKVAGHCPDEAKYKQRKDLRLWLPRGLVFARDGDGDGNWQLAIFAIRKFFGQGVNEDREEGAREYEDKVGSGFDKVAVGFVPTWKANGENAQLAIVYVNEERTIVCGSKNRKVFLRLGEGCDLERAKQDLVSYQSSPDSRYGIGIEVAELVLDRLAGLGSGEPLCSLFLSFMLMSRFTMCFEMESMLHPHIEALAQTRLVFIGFSSVFIEGQSTHPLAACVIARRFGFITVTDDVSTVSPLSSLDTYINTDVIPRYGKEGDVLYMVSEGGQVVDLIKVKCAWYVVARAIREKIKHIARLANEQAEQEILVQAEVVSRERLLQENPKLRPSLGEALQGQDANFITLTRVGKKNFKGSPSMIRVKCPCESLPVGKEVEVGAITKLEEEVVGDGVWSRRDASASASSNDREFELRFEKMGPNGKAIYSVSVATWRRAQIPSAKLQISDRLEKMVRSEQLPFKDDAHVQRFKEVGFAFVDYIVDLGDSASVMDDFPTHWAASVKKYNLNDRW